MRILVGGGEARSGQDSCSSGQFSGGSQNPQMRQLFQCLNTLNTKFFIHTVIILCMFCEAIARGDSIARPENTEQNALKLANWLKGSGSALLCLRPLVLITGTICYLLTS